MDAKAKIINAADAIADELVALSLNIHKNPELAFSEYKAAGFLAEFLEKHGFIVKMGIAGLPTAFRAEYRRPGQSQPKGPTAAFLAEYDALPEMGHACGHNLIAAMSAGAAVSLAAESESFAGSLVVLGTPGEEGLGGKILMAEKGVFDNVDYALMIHPGTENVINRGSTALCHWYVAFAGKSAHSSNPQDGINALSAVIQTFENIDRLRALMPPSGNVNGIITKGGTAANIITDRAKCEFTVRASTLAELKVVNGLVERAVKAAGYLYGAKPKIKKDTAYAELHQNRAMSETLGDNISRFGVKMLEPAGNERYGSTDIGNVSLIVPSIHPTLNIGTFAVAHTPEFTAASAAVAAHEAMLAGAKGLALTGFDILADAGLREKIQREFEQTVPRYDKNDFH